VKDGKVWADGVIIIIRYHGNNNNKIIISRIIAGIRHQSYGMDNRHQTVIIVAARRQHHQLWYRFGDKRERQIIVAWASWAWHRQACIQRNISYSISQPVAWQAAAIANSHGMAGGRANGVVAQWRGCGIVIITDVCKHGRRHGSRRDIGVATIVISGIVIEPVIRRKKNRATHRVVWRAW